MEDVVVEELEQGKLEVLSVRDMSLSMSLKEFEHCGEHDFKPLKLCAPNPKLPTPRTDPCTRTL